MAITEISGLRWLSYLVYGLVLTGILLFVRFPADKFEAFVVRKTKAALPGVDVTVGSYRYKFPLSSRLDWVVFSNDASGEEIVKMQNVSISPAVSGFGLEYSFAGDVYGGTFQADLSLSPVAKSYALQNIRLNGLELGKSAYLKSVVRREIGGYLDFSGSYSGFWEGTGARSAAGTVFLHDGRFSLLQPLLSLKSLDMKALEAELLYADGVLKLTDGSLKGQELHAQFGGTLESAPRPQGWKIELSGSLVAQNVLMKDQPQVLRVVKRLQQQYRKTALPFIVGGTIGNPEFRFGNAQER